MEVLACFRPGFFMNIPSVPTEHFLPRESLKEALLKQLSEKGPDDEYHFERMIFKLNRDRTRFVWCPHPGRARSSLKQAQLAATGVDLEPSIGRDKIMS